MIKLKRLLPVFLATLFIAGCSGSEGEEVFIDVQDYSQEKEGKTIDISNGELEFSFDADTTQFSVKNVKNGQVWYSNPQNADEDAIANGQPEVLTIDRVGKKANRRASLKGIDKVPGKDLDEYPPAMFKEGGNGASVRPINPSDNRGAGSSFGHKLRSYQNGTKIKFKITDD